ncbi:MAG TPA: hypothetical protein VF159_10410 [Gemmatimonadaceae bacterium]
MRTTNRARRFLTFALGFGSYFIADRLWVHGSVVDLVIYGVIVGIVVSAASYHVEQRLMRELVMRDLEEPQL